MKEFTMESLELLKSLYKFILKKNEKHYKA